MPDCAHGKAHVLRNQIIEITAGLNSLGELNEQVEGLNDIGYRIAHTLTQNNGENDLYWSAKALVTNFCLPNCL